MTELEQADQKWSRENDLAGALALLDAVIAREPSNVAALNFAGWLRTSQRADDARELALGIAQLKAALATASDDHRPAVNLAEALGTRGRAREAAELIRPWCEAHPSNQFAWNSLGWLLGVVLDDEAAGIAALKRHPWNPDARLNLGRIHLKAKRLDDAEVELSQALTSFRPHEAWLRLGEIHASRGHLRRAVGAFRRAGETDKRGEYSFVLHQAVSTLGNYLYQQKKYFLHAHEDSLLSQECERPRDRPSRRPPSLEELANRARNLRESIRSDFADACDGIARCAAQATLLPEYADQSFALRLEQAGSDQARELARDWREAQRCLYDELLDLEEPSPRVSGEGARIRAAAARRDWNAAFAALEAVDRAKDGGVELVAAFAELLGERLQRCGQGELAARAWAMSEAAYSQFASWATSGGEGMARMLDVNRLRAMQGLPPR